MRFYINVFYFKKDFIMMMFKTIKKLVVAAAIILPALSLAQTPTQLLKQLTHSFQNSIHDCPAAGTPGFCSCFVPQLIANCNAHSPFPSACSNQDTIRRFMLFTYGNNPANICRSNAMAGVSFQTCVASITFFLSQPYSSHCG